MASESAETAAANVVALRNRKGWTQQELADKCGIARPRIAEIESGRANPTIDTLDRVAKELGVPTARLFKAPDARKNAS